MPTAYTGTPDAVCPITLSHVNELAHPVAFRSNAAQPYELAPLWKWVNASGRHPLTGRACHTREIVALRVEACDAGCNRAYNSEAVLEGLRLTLQEAQVFASVQRNSIEMQERNRGDEEEKLGLMAENNTPQTTTVHRRKSKYEVSRTQSQAHRIER
jgi:hypothetical protein